MYRGVNSIGKNPWVLLINMMAPSIKGKGLQATAQIFSGSLEYWAKSWD